MNQNTTPDPKPVEILAPAGNRECFLAAISAGADAIYCGLKHFSARMEAENFSLKELCALVELAKKKDIRTYIALNTLLKPQDPAAAGRLLEQLQKYVQPEGLIIQDLGVLQLCRQVGFSGEVHLSTLANVSFGRALKLVGENLGVNRVVLPRELDIEEIKQLDSARPPGLDLEVFVHGALCYAVSGRCYWSSFLGGKSGLRGRCVQPCRRTYSFYHKQKRYFSCLDLSLDVLAKTLTQAPGIAAWKIEGRKKGPHYVFYAVKAYQIFRDQSQDPEKKKSAQELLQQALGRRGTHYYFLPQSPHLPIQPDQPTGSGLFVGRISAKGKSPVLRPREELLPGDLLRSGYEDEKSHQLIKVKAYVSKGKVFNIPDKKETPASQGSPVFLIDRKEPELKKRIQDLNRELEEIGTRSIKASPFEPAFPAALKSSSSTQTMQVKRQLPPGKFPGQIGLWLRPGILQGIGKPLIPRIWWWLPPVIWPKDEAKWSELLRSMQSFGARKFVLNAPWQAAFFDNRKGLTLWAGPFCNIANSLALTELQSLSFSGAIVSPELNREDFLELPRTSPLYLGFVSKGNWPLCISRTLAEELKTETLLLSPKKERSWVRKYGPNYWHFPNWQIDLQQEEGLLAEAGYSLFVHLNEPQPKGVKKDSRISRFNWDIQLL